MNDLAIFRCERANSMKDREEFANALAEYKSALSVALEVQLRRKIILEIDFCNLILGNCDTAEGARKYDLLVGKAAHDDFEGYIHTAQQAGKYALAIDRLSEASKCLLSKKCLLLEVQIFIDQYETTSARELINSTPSMPDALKAKYNLQMLFGERRYKEAGRMIETLPLGNASDYLRLKTQVLIGTGEYSLVEKELKTHNAFYADQEWIVQSLATNAKMAKMYDLAIPRWENIINSESCSDESFVAYIDVLIGDMRFEETKSVIENAKDRFKKSTISEAWVSLLKAGGDHDEAKEYILSTIESIQDTSPRKKIANLISGYSELMLQEYSNTGNKVWLKKYLEESERALHIDTDYYSSKIKYIDALIRCDEAERANAEISKLPQNYRAERLRLDSWQKYFLGDSEGSKKSGNLRRRIHYIPQIHDGERAELQRIDSNNLPDPSLVTLYTVIKNERKRLSWFLNYYRDMNVSQFVFVDNGSTDGSIEFLMEQTDVIIFSTTESYVSAYAGMVWVNYLKNKFSKNGWALYADVDEALVFDACESKDINDLVKLLETEGAEVLSGFMLDMFLADPQTTKMPSVLSHTEIDFIKSYPNYIAQHFHNPAPVCPYMNMRGGARSQFGSGEELTKSPLVKVSANVDFLRSSHDITAAKVSKYSCVFLHFKLIDGLEEEARAVLMDSQRSVHCQMRYRSYLESGQSEALLAKLSKEADIYVDSQKLVRQNLITRINEFHDKK